MAVFVVLARLLDPEDFGIMAIALALLAFVQVFVVAGFAEAIVQRPQLRSDHVAAAFWISTATGVVMCTTLVVVAPFFAELFDTPALAPIVRVFSLIFLFIGLSSTPKALLQRELDFRSIAARSVLGSTLGGAAAITAAVLGAGIWSLVVQAMTDAALGALILWRQARFRPALAFTWPAARELMGFSLYSMANQSVNFLHRYSDNLIVGWRLGSRSLGLYAIAYRTMRIVDDMISKVMLNVAFPTFAMVQESRSRSQRAFLTASRVSSAAIMPAFVGMAVCAPEIVTVVFGHQWDQAAPALSFLALAGLVQGFQYLPLAVLKASGRARTVFRFNVLLTAVQVGVFWIASRHGIVAVAAAYAVASYALAPIPLVLACRQLDTRLRRWCGVIVGPAASAVMLAAAAISTRTILAGQGDALRLSATALVGVITYGAAIRVVAPRALIQSIELVREAIASRRASPEVVPLADERGD